MTCADQFFVVLLQVDAVPVHMFGGAWGVIAAGLFSKPELLAMAYGDMGGNAGWCKFAFLCITLGGPRFCLCFFLDVYALWLRCAHAH